MSPIVSEVLRSAGVEPVVHLTFNHTKATKNAQRYDRVGDSKVAPFQKTFYIHNDGLVDPENPPAKVEMIVVITP